MAHITPLYTVAKQILLNFFKTESAGNYIAHEIEDLDTGESYIITMQKSDGETPLHQLAAAKDRIESLEHALKQALELSLRDSERFDAKRKDADDHIRDEAL
jgi:hypothetical protein